MKQVNAVGFDTPRGYRIAQLVHGDLTQLCPAVDVLVGSAYVGDYAPTSNSLVEGLQQRGFCVEELAGSPELDLREALGVWVSRALAGGPAHQLMFVEMRGGALPLETALENVFAALSLLEAKGAYIEHVAMPLLGAGSQGYAVNDVIAAILPQASRFLDRSVHCDTLSFVELNALKVDALSKAFDEKLGRRERFVSYTDLAKSVRKDVINRTIEAESLFDGFAQQREDWLQTLQAQCVSPAVFGVQARKLVELLLIKKGYSDGSLANRIRKLSDARKVAPWFCAYMDVIRQLGNMGAHPDERFTVEEVDLVAALCCMQRLLDQWST